jgi:hypothetical protein
MSEVDRLSNSGLYPALPLAEKQSRKDDSDKGASSGSKIPIREPKAAPPGDSNQPPRPPKSGIDEYA